METHTTRRADSAALFEREPHVARGCFFALAFAALFALAVACLVAAATGCAAVGAAARRAEPLLRRAVLDAATPTNAPAAHETPAADAGASPSAPSDKAPEAAEGSPGEDAPPAPGGVLQGAAPSAPSSPPSAPRLVFRYGSFDGGKAAESASARIRSLKLSSSGLSYAWESGGCEDLGAASATDYSQTLACAFYWSDAENAWIGGKFDWISSSRTTRSWENVRDRYNGWDPDAFFGSLRVAFCIVSKDGRRRTNLIEGAWK